MAEERYMQDSTISNRRALAMEHVRRGRVVVARQRALINNIRARQGDCSTAEGLLDSFERSLFIFEDDLWEIEKKETALERS
jgi:hypothetical protein